MPDRLSDLVVLARNGDQSALDEFLRDVRRAVLRYGTAQRLSREDADDLAQDVCIAVLAVVPEWQDSGRSVWGYVFTVARNKLADRVRHHVRQSALGHQVPFDAVAGPAMHLADAGPGPEDRALARAGTAQMNRLLDVLPATQREVLILRAVVGLSGAETAQVLGLALGSVHVLQHRAIKRLRSLFAQDPESVAP
jgi:RNA polymerase sigma-70 factor (ECF subfamily)